MSELTPLMKQYNEIKKNHQDAILFFRMGDFYEMFYGDAITASKILGITLTSRNKKEEGEVPLCGVPYRAAENYLSRLIKNGYKVAICEQMEDPATVRGIVRREVVRVLSPGAVLEPGLLQEKNNNFISSIYSTSNDFGFSFLDISTGEFFATEFQGEDALEHLLNELSRVQPKEVLIPDNKSDKIQGTLTHVSTCINPCDAWIFDYKNACSVLLKHFKVMSLDSLGCSQKRLAISAAGALLHYLQETQKNTLSNINSFRYYTSEEFMVLDETTQRNLELTRSLFEGIKVGSLLGILDMTMTAMGGRMLRNWFLRPLLNSEEIARRQDAIEEFKENLLLRTNIRSSLEEVSDLERLISRISLGIANARDMVSLKESVRVIPEIIESLGSCHSEMLRAILKETDDLQDIYRLIDTAITDDPPPVLNEGGLIRENYNPSLDELRAISRDGKDWISRLEAKERERTGIDSLKIRYNKVFSYYIEVTKANLSKIPLDYIRKQTIANGERFITPELKEYEAKVLGAEEKMCRLEFELFREVREKVACEVKRVQGSARSLGLIDVLSTLAEAASLYNYTRPYVDNGDIIRIVDGRHPVVERLNPENRFIPNDTILDEENRLLIITGPNMAGKSTYMRQVALIVLMAQMGSFIPAKEATIGAVDRIFTRIGAQDFLAQGQSTFMVEMTETANILHNATRRSLVLLDEVGRGTSTFDGVSIAWAVAEYLHNRIEAKTLFATHYHELTELSLTLPRVRTYNVSVKEWNDEIVFLHKISEGASDKSYGIQVARLAGLPAEVITRAKDVLLNLETKGLQEAVRAKVPQLDLFSARPDPVTSEILSLDLSNMTPLQALNKLFELKDRAEHKGDKIV